MGVISLTTLPDEIVQHVLFSALPQDALAFRLVSKRMNSLASEPLLWKHHCVTSFKYWAPEHQIRRKLLANVTDIDWKRIFLYRQDVASRTTRTLDSILSSQIERIGKFAEISKFGYDAKDALLQQCATRDAEEDVLSRR
jgi:F-box protein 21